ncbi:calcium-binding protein [Crocosphaera sp. XPORK-15E]|uniref:beta strand repeat-containing protein n=1 Tax=Crocosphaera sp. XPORK-15E TaxID=3110247 RepID=UPI002B220DB2|nr:calcium-binding protein [Crocosphaera sp. XPORK-15E]MEA5532568.1 calcium-binding protein [Crocosphaera sp. XPORK-15E]
MNSVPSLSSVYGQLTNFANLSNFWSLFDTAFGSSYDFATAASFRSQWQSGNFSLFPQIEIVSSDVLGSANGAYAISTNRIYLSDQFVSRASQQSLVNVILEEFGHFVDAQINTSDSAGDEGAIFAALVQGESLNVGTLQALKAEDDHGTITVNGQVIQVEKQDFTGTNGNDVITGTSGNDTIRPLRGQDLVDGGAGIDVLILDYTLNIYDGLVSSIASNGSGGFNGNYSANYTFGGTDKVTFSNIEQFQLTGTSKSDTIVTGDGNDTINGGEGDDWITPGAGNNIVDGGNGTDKIFYNFSSSTSNLTLDVPQGISIAPSGSSYTNIEAFDLITGSGNDIIKLQGRFNDTLTLGGGNDTVNPGFGNDVVDGGTGIDVLILDYTLNIYDGLVSSIASNGSGGFNGNYSANYTFGGTDKVTFSNIEQFQITGTSRADSIITGDGNDTINGGAGNDTIDGGAGNDLLTGVNPNSLNPGIGEKDIFSGGAGGDLFILGDFTWSGYDDGLTTNAGINNYADIADFNPTEGDIIQLKGGITYLLNVVGTDTQLLIDKPSTEPDELIGIIRNRTGLSLTGNYFVYNQLIPSITLDLSPASVLEDRTPNLVYTLTRTGSTTNALTVNYSITGTADTTDYTGATPGTGKTITFAANSATAVLTIDPTADITIESDETVALTLATGTGYTVGTTTAVTGRITNDDGPIISLGLNYSAISEDSLSNFIYTFTRTGATTNALTVNYSIAGTALSTDYTGATTGTGKTITFAVGSATATLTLDPTADTTLEPNETVILQLASGTGYTINTIAAQTATIINDDNTRNQQGTDGNNILLGKNYSDYLTGGTGNDILNGAGNSDYLTGGAGNDTLTGGSGGDTFFFANANLGIDTITDFTPNEDTIFISAQGFGSGLITGNPLTETQFILGSSATSASQRFIYNSTNGALLFDADGNGLGTAKQIATLSIGLAPTYEDIFVI